jgi:hypothetical protein
MKHQMSQIKISRKLAAADVIAINQPLVCGLKYRECSNLFGDTDPE